MAEQDRTPLERRPDREGVALISRALPRGAAGPYQLQAAIAAVHDEAPTAEDTDWPQIVALYEVLLQISRQPGGGAEPRRRGGDGQGAAGRSRPAAGAARPTTGSPRTTGCTPSARTCWRWPASRPRRAGRTCAAAGRTTSVQQQRYLHGRVARLDDGSSAGS